MRHDDKTGSGFDRGHLTPSADRTASEVDNEPTFILTNIVPQAPANNHGLWAQLEAHARDLLGQGNELSITAGGSGSQGTLADGKLTIPADLWKMILVLPAADIEPPPDDRIYLPLLAGGADVKPSPTPVTPTPVTPTPVTPTPVTPTPVTPTPVTPAPAAVRITFIEYDPPAHQGAEQRPEPGPPPGGPGDEQRRDAMGWSKGCEIEPGPDTDVT